MDKAIISTISYTIGVFIVNLIIRIWSHVSIFDIIGSSLTCGVIYLLLQLWYIKWSRKRD